MALTRRKAVAKPKPAPIPAREPEAETTLCVDPEPVKVKREVLKCSEPCIFAEYRDGLCFHHHKLSQGYVLDEKQNCYIKKEKK